MSLDITRDNIKFRFKTLKTTYGVSKALKEASGFGWDEVNKKIVASKKVWKYIKVRFFSIKFTFINIMCNR